MRICGVQKLAMVDYPGKLAATVFTGGCNLRCPFCHNALLVTRLEESPALDEGEVLDFLRKRKGLLEGVVLSGGEPLLQKGAAAFLAKVREMGYAVKLDTNGFYPAALAELLEGKLLDYVAMDIKNSREKYALTCGLDTVDLAAVEESIRLLRQSGVEYEFRTTMVRQLHTAEDLESIGRWLGPCPHYYLQNFVDSGNLIGSGFSAFTPEEMEQLAEVLRPWVTSVALRGL